MEGGFHRTGNVFGNRVGKTIYYPKNLPRFERQQILAPCCSRYAREKVIFDPQFVCVSQRGSACRDWTRVVRRISFEMHILSHPVSEPVVGQCIHCAIHYFLFVWAPSSA